MHPFMGPALVSSLHRFWDPAASAAPFSSPFCTGGESVSHQFHPVSVGIQDDGLIEIVTRYPGFPDDPESIGPQPLRHLIYLLPAAGIDGKVNQPRVLFHGVVPVEGYIGHLHNLQPCAAIKREKIGTEFARMVVVGMPRRRIEIMHVKIAHPLQIVSPDGYMVNGHNMLVFVQHVYVR